MKVLTLGKKVQVRFPTAEDFVKTGLLFLISRATVMGVSPFGIAFWAAAIPERSAYLGLIGMLAGIFSAGGDVLKYSLAAGLYLIYTYFRKSRLTDPIFCGFAALIGGVVSSIFSGQAPIYIAMSIPEGILTALGYMAAMHANKFVKAYKNNTKASQEEIISAVIMCGIFLTGFSGIYITHNLHVCTFLGIYLILCLSKCVSAATAGSIGLALGLICSMNSPSAILIMGICGLGAILANLLKDFGKIGCSAGFLAAGVISVIYMGDYQNMPISIYEYIVAAAMFFATPKSVLAKGIISKAVKSGTGGKEVRIKEYLSGELKHIAKAFTDLAESFLSVSHREDNAAQASDMFDEVAERVCKNCSDWGSCWIDGFNDMYRQMYGILKIIETSGYCDINNLPIAFKDKCVNAEKFISEFNHLYEIYKQTAMWKGEANLGQDMVARQYHEISNLIKGLSEDVETGFSFIESAELKLDNALEKAGVFAKEINVIENFRREPEVYISAGFGAESSMMEKIVSDVIGMPMQLENNASYMKFVAHNKYYVEYAVCQRSCEADSACGDTVMQFETEDNKFCVLLCDGMGSGSEASEESRLTAELLQDFIKAGFIKNTAVKMINSTLAMKAGKENFSTIDMAEIDLRSGKAEFLKVGAAQSYILHSGELEVISEKALPVGILEDIQIPTVERFLSDGDIIVITSDGISETGYGNIRGAWIKSVITEHSDNMQELADELLKTAQQKAYPKPCDDMTAAVMRIRLL